MIPTLLVLIKKKNLNNQMKAVVLSEDNYIKKCKNKSKVTASGNKRMVNDRTLNNT